MTRRRAAASPGAGLLGAGLLGAAGLLSLSCARRETVDALPGPAARAEFGVYYGGQIQERERIPLELDRTRQIQGFRIDFDAPLAREVIVAWELDMPGSTRGIRDVKGRIGRGRLIRHDEARVPAGHTRFDQTVYFAPKDPLGVWNIRVRVDDEIVIDRPFEVVRP